MKQQVIIIKVKFDETENQSPKNWNWSQLLGCERDCVEILNYGDIEDVGEREVYK